MAKINLNPFWLTAISNHLKRPLLWVWFALSWGELIAAAGASFILSHWHLRRRQRSQEEIMKSSSRALKHSFSMETARILSQALCDIRGKTAIRTDGTFLSLNSHNPSYISKHWTGNIRQSKQHSCFVLFSTTVLSETIFFLHA